MKKITSLLSVFVFLFFAVCTTSFAQGNEATAKALHKLMDAWHLAAAAAKAKPYFEFMHKDAIYLGTDATERWTKAEFQKFAMPYFDKGKAWAFKPLSRHFHASPDGKTYWFDEQLQTWMGVCRGSGVIMETEAGWKLMHYNLAVTVPNAAIQDFIEITEESEIKSVVYTLFKAMQMKDTATIRQVMLPDVRLLTSIQKEGKKMIVQSSLDKFAEGVMAMGDKKVEERPTDFDIEIDDNIASAWVPYMFFVDEKLAHCGTNALQLVKTDSGWRILQIMDTRKGCSQGKEKE